MRGVTIRFVGFGNDHLVGVLQHLHEKTLPGDTLPDFTTGWWWLAWDYEMPVAFAGFKKAFRTERAAYLCRCGVNASYRGQGLQRRLIRVREREARRQGFHALVSDTAPNNHHSANNLIACGFRLFGPPVPWNGPDWLYWRKTLAEQ